MVSCDGDSLEPRTNGLKVRINEMSLVCRVVWIVQIVSKYGRFSSIFMGLVEAPKTLLLQLGYAKSRKDSPMTGRESGVLTIEGVNGKSVLSHASTSSTSPAGPESRSCVARHDPFSLAGHATNKPPRNPGGSA